MWWPRGARTDISRAAQHGTARILPRPASARSNPEAGLAPSPFDPWGLALPSRWLYGSSPFCWFWPACSLDPRPDFLLPETLTGEFLISFPLLHEFPAGHTLISAFPNCLLTLRTLFVG